MERDSDIEDISPQTPTLRHRQQPVDMSGDTTMLTMEDEDDFGEGSKTPPAAVDTPVRGEVNVRQDGAPPMNTPALRRRSELLYPCPSLLH